MFWAFNMGFPLGTLQKSAHMGNSDPESPNFKEIFLGQKLRTFVDAHTKNNVSSTKLRSKGGSLLLGHHPWDIVD